MKIHAIFGRFGVAAVTVLLSLSALFMPAVSQATSSSCAFGNPLYGPDYYCATVNGSGNWVSSVQGMWRGSAFTCNAYITAEFFDNGWHWYQTRVSGTQWGCGTGGNAIIYINSYKYTGWVCSTLHYTNGAMPGNRVMSTCMKIN